MMYNVLCLNLNVLVGSINMSESRVSLKSSKILQPQIYFK